MDPGLSIRVVDPDDDYLGLDIAAATRRYAGTVRIYAGREQLSEFAKAIGGFPSSPTDSRTYAFGTREPGYAGGFVRLTFTCTDSAGHSIVLAELDDDTQLHRQASARFSFAFEPAALDRFLEALRVIERIGQGHAELPASA